MSFMKKNWPLEKERRQRRNNAQMTGPIKTGLRQKFLSAVLLFILLFSTLLYIFFHFSTKQTLIKEFEKRGFAIATHIAFQSEEPLMRPPLSALAKVISTTLNIEDVHYISLLDKDGLRLIGKEKDYIPQPKPLSAKQLNQAKPFVQTILSTEGTQCDFVVPVFGFGEGKQDLNASSATREKAFEKIRIGTVRLGLSPRSIYDEIRKTNANIIIGVSVCLIVGVLLALYLFRIVVLPIQKLANAMKIVSDGEDDFDQDGLPSGRRFRRFNDLDLHIKTHDEIEQLADEFQAMVAKLENSYSHLEEIIKEKIDIAHEKSRLVEDMEKLNRRNETVIKERTREIVEKNLRLYEISEELQFQKEELISMNEQLEKSSRMKSEFLANMSHELRTPLNSIIGFAEVLRERMFGELNDRQEKYLSNILNSGKHLLNLINNILDISKVEAGKMNLIIEAFPINKVIDEVQSIIRTLAYKKNIRLLMEYHNEIMVEGDPSKFKQILYNLISNAIKFTDEKGTVTLTTQEAKIGTYFEGGPGAIPFVLDADGFTLKVVDTGIGIKPEDQERIFNEFEQLDQTSRRKYEGTGLGLTLTRKLVHLHGGHIWVQSEFGKGTEVWVVLPIKAEKIEIDETEETP